MALSSVGGLGKCYFEQLDRDATTGEFDHMTAGTDVFGDPFTTLHIMGSQEESTPSRDENGINSLDITVFETDVDRANMIENVAPVASASASETSGSRSRMLGGLISEGTRTAGGPTPP